MISKIIFNFFACLIKLKSTIFENMWLAVSCPNSCIIHLIAVRIFACTKTQKKTPSLQLLSTYLTTLRSRYRSSKLNPHPSPLYQTSNKKWYLAIISSHFSAKKVIYDSPANAIDSSYKNEHLHSRWKYRISNLEIFWKGIGVTNKTSCTTGSSSYTTDILFKNTSDAQIRCSRVWPVL